jgi:hypothetical protein
MSGSFTCEQCRGTFPKAWSDEERDAEAKANGFDLDDAIIVCDDCYKAIMAFNEHTPGAPK